MNPFRLQGLQQGQHILRYRAIVEQHGDDAAHDLPAGDSIQAQAGILFHPVNVRRRRDLALLVAERDA